MSSEDQEILAKISQLAGQINRHKNGQISDPQSQYQPPTRAPTYGGMDASTPTELNANRQQGYQASAGYRGRGGYPRGTARGGRPQVHRNRSLVLNGNTPATNSEGSTNDENTQTGNARPAWITKNDRHLQLINSKIFEKDSQKRAKALEETRLQKMKQRDEREQMKFKRHLQRTNGTSRSADSGASYEVVVNGIRFRVTKHGSKLMKVPGESPVKEADNSWHDESVMGLWCPGDLNAARSTPKSTIIGGVRFHRSKSGNMYRAGAIKKYRQNAPVKKVDELCKAFTTTGSCIKGNKCRYIHDHSKVAVCKEFLQKGTCPSGDSCDLSHELTPERTPTCLHFTRGNCSNPNCRYTHVRVSPSALVCRQFGIYGYCEKGASCTERHVSECPEFSNTGKCSTKGCKLPHRQKASVMRSNQSRDQSGEEESDISSDEDEEIGSDDVDSDDLEEFFGDDGDVDEDIPMQQDYVQL